MSRWRTNGGWNKRCGTVEKTPRIDSFEAKEMFKGMLFAYCDSKMRAFNCGHYIDWGPDLGTDQEIVELWKGEWCQTLELSRIPSGFGGSRPFWLCPACVERRRYLYLTGDVFLCRKCAQVNYKSQQVTRSDSMYYYHKGMDLVEKRLDCWPLIHPDGFSFCGWMPDRPRYMHQATYQRYLSRFLRYRRKHADRQMADMLRLLKMFK